MMKRELTALSIFLLGLLLVSFLHIQSGISTPAEIIVPDQYSTIQAAINHASNGDTVLVKAGNYYEHVVVNKTVSLLGEDADTTIIDGSFTGRVVSITRNNVNISGFTIQHSGQDPNVAGPPYGDAGIYMIGVSHCNIDQNRLVEDAVGIQLETGANSNALTNNIIANNSMGVSVALTSLNSVTGNWVSNNSLFSIGLPWGAQSNVVSDNYITSLGLCAIYIDGSHYNSVLRNCVANSTTGIWIFRSGNNRIYHNTFTNNTRQVNSTSPVPGPSLFNYWDGGYSFGGNYWSDYNGTDANHDGKGDTPCTIDANNTDRYPLVNPFSGIVVPDQYPTIQAAINRANDGDTVFVRAGTYYEHVFVNRTVALVGENRDTTIIDGSYIGVVVNVTRDGVGISNFTIRRSGTTWNIGGPPYGAGIYLRNVTDCTISGNRLTQDAAGIQLEFGADGNVIANNILTSVGIGLGTFDASWNSFIGNNVTSNGRGLGLNVNSDYNTISGNRITASEWVIALHMCNYNNITENYIANGQIGIYLPDSSYNRVYHNQIVNNVQQASVQGPPSHLNYWDDGYPSGGNYWSGYSGADSDRDGIGDTPYVIDSDNIDHYPLFPLWIPADVNHDLKVDILDVVRITGAYGATPLDPNWDPYADIMQPYGKIDILDVVACTSHYGERYLG